MYKVIGADGKEYGPVSLEGLQQWLAQGRINPQSRVQEVGSTEWKTAAQISELTAAFAQSSGTPPPLPTASPLAPAGQQTSLAIASLVLGILSLFFCIITGIPAIICGHIGLNRARRMPAQYGGSGMAIAGLVLGYFSLVLTFLVLPAMLLPALAGAKARAQEINCANNMKMVGLAFRTWALDHNDQYPFNVSTNAGGTAELCLAGPDGFDRDAAFHFMALSNELATTTVLICPADKAKKPAPNFAALTAANVSYELRSGTNLTDSAAGEVLAVCPIHGHKLLSDGTVEQHRNRLRRRL